ncbi:hypothetical protein [Nostoc cycadae]|uniref:Uncharacterized protein n=1 Tax=Nostoc cycadae WK-1 TaxID=1861711 RepID=A0A2H6LKE7_9NOSO|nr:hypothetical protein [Nostoc cycadae]GBE93673.1 hypothetical protein NCWK1_3438 [Nostoc cycadae WK-1]
MHELALDSQKLNELVDKCKHFSIYPRDIPSYERGSLQKPGVNELLIELVNQAIEDLLVLSQQERKSLVKSYPAAMNIYIDIDSIDFNDEIDIKKVAVYYIGAEIHRRKYSFKKIVNETTENSTVINKFPELKQKLDDDNLLLIDDSFTMHDYGIEYEGYIIQYHRLLRSKYLSYSNSKFLGRWISYYESKKLSNSFRIAVDHHSEVLPKENYGQVLEFDTWYGPAFDLDRIDDPSYTGLTVVKRNKNSLFEDSYKLDRTEFFWSHKDGIKTFEIEEISDNGQWYDHYLFNRYIHSERDTNRGVTRHLDGAVKIYLKNDYQRRFETYLPDKSSYKKIKMWRVDGDIDVDRWITLISFFYDGNEMVYEYFDPAGFKEKFELRVRDFKEWKKQQNDAH